MESDEDAAISELTNFAQIIFEVTPFSPKSMPENWQTILEDWLRGNPVSRIVGQDSNATIEFVEDALVYRLPWGIDAVRLHTLASTAGDLESGELPTAFGDIISAVEAGTLNTSAAFLIHAGFNSRSGALAVGDTIRLLGSDHDWTVVGFTHDTTFQAAPVVTMDSQALRQHGPTSLSPAVSAVVFTSDLTTDSKATQSAKDAGLTILTTEELVRTLPGYSAQVLTFSLMIGSLIIIASTVLGIFIYVLTLQKRPVLGILKARGVPTGYLIRSGCAQTLVLSVAGIGIGLLLTMATSLVLPRAVPFRISAVLDLLIVTAFIAISVIGGFISVRVISRIDPVEAIS